MEELINNPPKDIYYYSLDGSDDGVFAIKWEESSFENFDEFRLFSSKYSSAMQALIQLNSMQEAEDWYVPEPEQFIEECMNNPLPPLVKGDAQNWVSQNYPFISIDWLLSGDHDNLYIYEPEHCEDWPELVSFGQAGYFNIFVASSL